jgi:phosphoribosyl-AMP cyclohydrolase
MSKLDAPFDSQTIEGTTALTLNFGKIFSNNQEVLPVAVQNKDTKEVILIAYTNELAFMESIKKRQAIFWSTSRKKLWHKGEESGYTFTLHEIYVNCEQNSLVYMVTPDKGNICHTSINNVPNNCYYRRLNFETMELEYIKD